MTFRAIYFLLLPLLAISCTETPSRDANETKGHGEYIIRLDGEKRLDFDAPKSQLQQPYPWQENAPRSLSQSLHHLNKDYFRCKGSNLNPAHVIEEKGKEIVRLSDCGGAEKHSLPLRNDNEYIYPILIELLNYIQQITKKPVIITSAHRCPTHNSYVDPSPQNSASKHMIGAEVDFYIQGMENQPEAAVKIILDFYKTQARYQLQKEYLEFKRFEKKTNVHTLPWYNKEIFIKVFKATEGRNYDNRHAHPYLNLQVRFDRERNLAVNFTWEQAQAFLRK